jgi:hypothetical protein
MESGLAPVMVTAAENVVTDGGVNVILTVQKALAARLAGQLFVCAKSTALIPVMAIPLIVAAPDPLLVTVTTCAVLVVFTVWLGKAMEEGDGETLAFVLRISNDDAQVPEIPMT